MKISNHLRVCMAALAALCAGAALALSQPAGPASLLASPAQAGAPAQASAAAPACGVSWNTISSRVVGSGLTILNDIAALAPDNMWAVGSQITNDSRYPQPLAMHWDGRLWTPAVVPTLSPGGRLEGLTAIAANDIWAVGAIQSLDTSQTLTMHWDGATWSIVDSPNGLPTAYNSLHDVEAIGPNDVWAIGDDSVSALLFHWDGVSWKSVAYPSSQGQSLRGIVAIAPNDIWAVGLDGTHPIHWNGATWSLSTAPIADALLHAVDGSSTNDVWAVGTRANQPFAMHWNGTSWSQSTLPALELGDYVLNKVAVLSPRDVWAVGRASYSALALHWDGAAWHDISPPRSPRGNEIFRSVAALSSGNVWAAGTINLGPGASRTMVKQYAPSIELSGTNVNHASAVATISASLSSTAVQTVTVAYSTSDGTAIAGQEYAATSGVLAIPPCQTGASFTVPLMDISTWKPSATINISISSPEGAQPGGRTSMALNIADTTKAPPGQVANMPILARSAGTPAVDRIAYASTQGNNTDVWLMNDDGGNRHPLTSNPARDYDPAWSPDGRRLAFVSERDGNPEIYVMNADGSQQTRLTRDPQSDTAPSWSPDGRSIAFVSNRTRVGQAAQQLIFRMNADGSQQTQLTPVASSNRGDSAPAWSPDSRQLAFASQREGATAIYVINASGGQIRRVTPLNISALDPIWINNGQRLAFFIPLFGYSNIATIGVDGNQLQLLNPNFDTATPFSFSGDEARIVFSDGYEITIMTVAGGEPHILPQGGQNAFDPVFAPR